MSEAPAAETGAMVRLAARAGFSGLTVGRAPGRVQANVFIVPAAVADDLEGFCHANPAACPLLARGAPGETALTSLGAGIDIRTDLPAYAVHASGTSRRVTDITPLWRDDHVAFALGCWFGAEQALAAAGVRMRHRERGLQGPLFRTSRDATPCGALAGPLVVSMRPFRIADIAQVRAITARLPMSHGAPIHEGDPAALGIRDPLAPDWGEALPPTAGERALFWPCGLTALAALLAVPVPFFISHAPGAMLVTDIAEVETQ